MLTIYVVYIKPLISGPSLEKYAIFLGAFLLCLWTLLAVRAARGEKIGSSTSAIVQAFMSLLFFSSILGLVLPSPVLVAPNLPLFEPLPVGPTKPLSISFDRPISKKITAAIFPSVSGNWKLAASTFRIPYNTFAFYPEKSLPPDTEFTVEISQIAPLTGLNLKGNDKLLFVFKTPPEKLDDRKPITENLLKPTPTVNISLKEEVFAEENTPTPPPDTASAPKIFLLNVPQYKQHYSFTCFSVAAKMALGYRNVTIDEIGFLHEIGFDQTPRNFATNTWGDPNISVVGTYDGSGDGGYGVHWDPVAKVMNKYRKIEVKHKWTIPDLLKTVEEGNPTMVWWVNGVWPARDVSWNLPGGGKVYTVNGMHVEVVVGWTGARDNPTTILTNDPWRGRRSYTPEQFLSLWKWFENTAVVVY